MVNGVTNTILAETSDWLVAYGGWQGLIEYLECLLIISRPLVFVTVTAIVQILKQVFGELRRQYFVDLIVNNCSRKAGREVNRLRRRREPLIGEFNIQNLVWHLTVFSPTGTECQGHSWSSRAWSWTTWVNKDQCRVNQPLL